MKLLLVRINEVPVKVSALDEALVLTQQLSDGGTRSVKLPWTP